MAESILAEIGRFIGAKFAQIGRVAFTNSFNDLDDKPTIQSVPNWATQASKPKYTASEVGAIATAIESDLIKKSRIFLVKPATPQEGDIYIQQ